MMIWLPQAHVGTTYFGRGLPSLACDNGRFVRPLEPKVGEAIDEVGSWASSRPTPPLSSSHLQAKVY